MQVQSGETPGGSPCHSPTGLGVPGSLTHFSACLSKVALPQVPEPALPPGAEVAHLAEQKVQVSQTSRARESVSAAAAKVCSLRLRPPGEAAKLVEEEAPAQPQTGRPDPADPGSCERAVPGLPRAPSHVAGPSFLILASHTYFGKIFL